MDSGIGKLPIKVPARNGDQGYEATPDRLLHLTEARTSSYILTST